MTHFHIACLTPPGLPDPSIAIAASRAGELGILNLEFVVDQEQAVRSLLAMTSRTPLPTGVRFGIAAPAFVSSVFKQLPETVRVIILSGAESEPLSGWIHEL